MHSTVTFSHSPSLVVAPRVKMFYLLLFSRGLQILKLASIRTSLDVRCYISTKLDYLPLGPPRASDFYLSHQNVPKESSITLHLPLMKRCVRL